MKLKKIKHMVILMVAANLLMVAYKFNGELNPFGCGQGSPAIGLRDVIDSNRVIGGGFAQPNTWPWHAIIFEKNVFICGGSLLDSYWAVTAAHCTTHTS